MWRGKIIYKYIVEVHLDLTTTFIFNCIELIVDLHLNKFSARVKCSVAF